MDSVIDYTGIRDKAKAAWQLTFDGLAVDQASAIQELVKWIVNGHSPFHPVLRGESYLPSGKSIKLLTNALIQYLARDRDKIIIWQTYLRLLIISGNRLGVWNLELPALRSEEHTSELQSRENLVCRLLLEKKKHNCFHIP